MEQEAICKDVQTDIEGVKTFVFECKKKLKYMPGQFITLVLPTEDGDILRSYTLSSAPNHTSVFSITVRAVPYGTGSNWLHNNLQPGMPIFFSGAYGKFIPAEYEDNKLLLMAAGSGITPHLATLRHWRNQAKKVNAHLIFSVRSPSQIIEQQELLALVRQINGLTLTIIPEDVTGQAWHGVSGRIDPLWLNAMVRNVHERVVFVCGPAPYMRAIKEYLMSIDFDLTRYHEEAFISPMPISHQQVSTNTPTYSVNFIKSGVKATTSGNESLLELAEKAGVAVKNACRSGICGACRTLKKEGHVNMQDLGGILPDEVNQGMVLLCCSQPTSDVVLDI
ncbi:iron-sulfur cluster-binding domain-containing protein [Motilimonas cestriensis]|uniref:Iron-sulfur cluster-binding domain-containing protein n=1 Tax=Motilimonas cestriensis TaxID=2742685 RepID=A0ABS8WA04_9GAMM|nr:iron-sulfur cluster-binding domain-containing protein [Motilimonas cestriensis]MCE2595058.1 iron-sulfur cluster-binding domain-containing protein [Motilimonas cestriensis]